MANTKKKNPKTEVLKVSDSRHLVDTFLYLDSKREITERGKTSFYLDYERTTPIFGSNDDSLKHDCIHVVTHNGEDFPIFTVEGCSFILKLSSANSSNKNEASENVEENESDGKLEWSSGKDEISSKIMNSMLLKEFLKEGDYHDLGEVIWPCIDVTEDTLEKILKSFSIEEIIASAEKKMNQWIDIKRTRLFIPTTHWCPELRIVRPYSEIESKRINFKHDENLPCYKEVEVHSLKGEGFLTRQEISEKLEEEVSRKPTKKPLPFITSEQSIKKDLALLNGDNKYLMRQLLNADPNIQVMTDAVENKKHLYELQKEIAQLTKTFLESRMKIKEESKLKKAA